MSYLHLRFMLAISSWSLSLLVLAAFGAGASPGMSIDLLPAHVRRCMAGYLLNADLAQLAKPDHHDQHLVQTAQMNHPLILS